MPHSEQDHDRGSARFVRRDEIRAHLVDLPDVGQRRGVARAEPLQVVVEVRQIDQRQRRTEPVFDDSLTLPQSTVSTRSTPGAPEIEQRKRAEPGLQFVAQRSREGVDVGQLASIGRIHRPRRDADVRRGIHVEPPEHVRAREGRIAGARDVPDFRREHQAVRLTPEAHLAVLAHVPSRCRRCRGWRDGRRSDSPDCAVQVTAGNAASTGTETASRAHRAIDGAPRAIRSPVRPTTLRTTVFCIVTYPGEYRDVVALPPPSGSLHPEGPVAPLRSPESRWWNLRGFAIPRRLTPAHIRRRWPHIRGGPAANLCA